MDSRCLTENAVVEFVEGRLAPAAIADLERHLDECDRAPRWRHAPPARAPTP